MEIKILQLICIDFYLFLQAKKIIMKEIMKTYRYECFSFLMLISGLVLTHFQLKCFAEEYIRMIWYLTAFLPVGLPVMMEALGEFKKGNFANEFTLMSLSTVGAFCIGEYPEGVAVMLFYAIGEKLQDKAVNKARGNIRALLNMRPRSASVIREGKKLEEVPLEMVRIGETVEVKVGELVPLDGNLQDESALLNTSTLTGESMPKFVRQTEDVLAGMIPSDHAICLTVSRLENDSALARVLRMVEEAAERKAPTELLIRKIARIYTPVVMGVALLILVVPFIYGLFISSFHYLFADWLYRALVFLVVSCPCALVISIPVSYFAGIGAASRRGILFKGGNFLDAVTKIDTVVFDKTGTLTTGNFRVEKIKGFVPEEELLRYAASAENLSTHPLAKAVTAYAMWKGVTLVKAISKKELPGYGLETEIDGCRVLVGNCRLMDKYGIGYPDELRLLPESVILCAREKEYLGCIILCDELKKDAFQAISELKEQGINRIEILSGDKDELVKGIGRKLGVDRARGDLLPEGKVKRLRSLKEEGCMVAFVGDGINDAPVLTLSHVGVAMGALGSDVAIEAADVVIQNDCPSRLAEAIRIGRCTRRIVWQNIILVFSIKLMVLILGIGGFATLWEAVFADSGVALLVVGNAMRIGRLAKF